MRRSRPRFSIPKRPSRRSTWIVVLARTLRTGKSDSPARSPLSSTTPARSGPSGDFVSSSLAVAASHCPWRARHRRARGGTAPDRCPRRPRSRGSRPSRRRGRSARIARLAGPRRRGAPRVRSWSCRSGKRELERPPDHERDEALLRHGGGLERPLADAVAENGDPIGDAEHLGQPVADVDDADAGAALLEHERVEPLDVLRPERGRRLVEEQHLRLGEQRLDDLEELSLGERQRPRRARSAGCRARTRRAARPPTAPCVRTSVGASAGAAR